MLLYPFKPKHSRKETSSIDKPLTHNRIPNLSHLRPKQFFLGQVPQTPQLITLTMTARSPRQILNRTRIIRQWLQTRSNLAPRFHDRSMKQPVISSIVRVQMETDTLSTC